MIFYRSGFERKIDFFIRKRSKSDKGHIPQMSSLGLLYFRAALEHHFVKFCDKFMYL